MREPVLVRLAALDTPYRAIYAFMVGEAHEKAREPAGLAPGRSRDQLQPEVAPQVSHLQHDPLRTSVSWPQSEQGSPSYPFMRA